MKKKDTKKLKQIPSLKMNILFNYLRKIITWQSLSLVVAIVMPIIIYHCQKVDVLRTKPDNVTLLKDSIRSYVNIIESSFNMSTADNDDSFIRFYNIRSFQNMSLEYASTWNSLTNAPAMETFKSEPIRDVQMIVKERLVNIKYFRLLLIDIVNLMAYNEVLCKMDSTYYYYFMLNKEDIVQIDIKEDGFAKRFDYYLNKMDEKYKQSKIYESKDSITKNNPYYVEYIVFLDSIVNCTEFYDYNNAVFKLIVKQNKKYMAAYKINLEKVVARKDREELEKYKDMESWN